MFFFHRYVQESSAAHYTSKRENLHTEPFLVQYIIRGWLSSGHVCNLKKIIK